MSDGIHRAAAEGFGAAALAYERGRPGYPPEAVTFVIETLGVGPQRTVLDLGAGTGKLTRLLEPTGARMVAMEPIAVMLIELVTRSTSANALSGTAEAIPLVDAAVDAVVVRQEEGVEAFQGGGCLSECREGQRFARVQDAVGEEKKEGADPLALARHEFREVCVKGAQAAGTDGGQPMFSKKLAKEAVNAALEIPDLGGHPLIAGKH